MRAPRNSGRARTVLSLESVLTECLAALDESGAGRMSVRELARRLGAGTGSIYWYVRTKEELLDLAVDRILSDVLTEVRRRPPGDPLDEVRAIAFALFNAFDKHPWTPRLVVQDPLRQPHSAQTLDLIGRSLARLGLTLEQQFHTATTVMTHVVGTCAQMSAAQSAVGDAVSRRAHLAAAAGRWDSVDPEQLPFLHAVSPILRAHDDVDQFRFGLDLLLAGIRSLPTATRDRTLNSS